MKNKMNEPTFEVVNNVKKVTIVEDVADVKLREYVSKRIICIQKEKKISSRELAFRMSKKHENCISRLRSGKYNLNLISLYELCKALDCKSSDILPF